jgi:hypothetical protein
MMVAKDIENDDERGVGGDVWELCHEIAFFPSVRSSRCIA